MILLGEVWTQTAVGRVAAVRWDGAAITDVGSEADVTARYPGERRVAFERITPGLHDAHAHPLWWGQQLTRLDLSGVADPRVAAEKVAERARSTPPGEWIAGAGYLFDDYPDRRLLDEAAPTRPVFIKSRDLHSGWANSLALEMAQVDLQTPDPEEGRIVRRPDGQPSGILLEAATSLVERLLPPPAQDDLERGLRDFAQRGYTAVHHMGWTDLAFAESLASPVRLWWALDADDWRDHSPGWHTDRLHVASVKFFMDGALGSKTAWMNDPYPDGSLGMPLNPAEFVRSEGADAIRSGFGVVAHAIGTRAVDELLSIYEDLARLNPARPLRMEHAQHVRSASLARFRSLPLAVSMQPIHAVDDEALVRAHTPGRESEAFRLRDLWDIGAPMAYGSDAPVASPAVGPALEAAVAGPFQRVTLEEAIWAHTRGAALAAGWANQGLIQPGAWADLTLWEAGAVVGRVFDGVLELA